MSKETDVIRLGFAIPLGMAFGALSLVYTPTPAAFIAAFLLGASWFWPLVVYAANTNLKGKTFLGALVFLGAQSGVIGSVVFKISEGGNPISICLALCIPLGTELFFLRKRR